MPYSFLEHTADVRMSVTDGTLPGLFEQALAGIFAFLRPVRRAEEVTRTIALSAPDSTALLVDFLNEALALAQAHKEAYEEVRFDRLVRGGLRAQLAGRKVRRFDEDIKAVTHHEAKVERTPEGGWHAHIVFDI